MALSENIKIPAFSGVTDSGNIISQKNLKGAWTVLYFYPKDDTTGCTKQACDFRDSMKSLRRAGVQVIGVSPDSVASHGKFKVKYDLPFPLISDEDHTICEAFDVWKEKSMYGRKYMGVERTTYIIQPSLKIARTFEKVKVPGHVDALREALKDLGL